MSLVGSDAPKLSLRALCHLSKNTVTSPIQKYVTHINTGRPNNNYNNKNNGENIISKRKACLGDIVLKNYLTLYPYPYSWLIIIKIIIIKQSTVHNSLNVHKKKNFGCIVNVQSTISMYNIHSLLIIKKT